MTKEKANEIEHIDDKTSTDVGDIGRGKARDAGMSYREYYGFLKSMKNI